jgi:hypothetical protein
VNEVTKTAFAPQDLSTNSQRSANNLSTFQGLLKATVA